MNIKLKKTWAWIALLASGISTLGYDFAEENPAHSYVDYNKRFIEGARAPIMEPGQVYYVALNGDDGQLGSKAAPFKTLEAARDAVRKLKRSAGLPKGGVHIVIQDGNYTFSQPFQLTKEDSGTAEAPIVYRGSAADKVFISGGLEIDTAAMSVVIDDAKLAWLNPVARGKVMSVKLSEEAVKRFPGDRQYGLLSMNGHLLTLAQWPNVGYHHIKDIVAKGPTTRWLKPGEEPAAFSRENPTGGTFTFRETLSPLVQQEFERSGAMHAEGYFHNDWYFQNEPVGGIKDGEVQLMRYTRYGIEAKIRSIPRRVRLVNVLAELDQPGEWYVDRTTGELFVWPVVGFVPGEGKVYALWDDDVEVFDLFGAYYTVKIDTIESGAALIKLDDTEYITFRDMTVQNMSNQAFGIDDGKYNLIAGCTIRNGMNRGVTIAGGRHNGITGCNFYDLECAFDIYGGNFKKLERCYNFATNNDVHSCRRRGYAMIQLDGVGIYFAHNVVHDMNGAVNFRSVDSLLEFNEFYNIGYEMGDFNVAYCGSLWYTMNNVVRYNFVHHLIEPGGHPVAAFRNDDGGAGLQLYGNVFYRPGRCSVQFAGPLNSFRNNISLNSSHMWWTNKCSIDPEGIQAAWKRMERFGRDLPQGDKGDNIFIMEQLLGKDGWKKGVWKKEFPQLAETIEINPFAQTFCNVSANYISGIRTPYHVHGGDGTVEGMESGEVGDNDDLPKNGKFEIPTRIASESAFVDVSKLNFNFKPDFRLLPGFKAIPFDQIGFVKDEFRPNPPAKEAYRTKVYNQFKNDKGGRYHADKVNARYPTPSYLK